MVMHMLTDALPAGDLWYCLISTTTQAQLHASVDEAAIRKEQDFWKAWGIATTIETVWILRPLPPGEEPLQCAS
jgi:hypothetical protein